MSCRQQTRNVLLLAFFTYILLYINQPLLPDSVRLPITRQLDSAVEVVLRLVDPLLKPLQLDRLSRTGEPFKEATAFHDVPTLANDDDLKKSLATHGRIFLMAHAPWCGHCKNMHGQYAQLYDQITQDFINFPDQSFGVYTHDAAAKCDDDPKSCHIESLSQHIRGFPTLLVIEAGADMTPAVTPYMGQRSADALFKFALDQVLDPITTESALQAKSYFEEFQQGILHYVPKGMSLKDARKFSAGFSMKQQLFTTDYEVAKYFAEYNSGLKKDEHIMLAFAGGNYRGPIRKDNPAPIQTIVEMYSHSAMGFFTDKEFMSLQLPRHLLMVAIRSKKFESTVMNEFLAHCFVQPQIVGQAAIVIIDPEKETESRIASMIGMSEGEQDCMIIFDQMTSKRHGICVPNIAEWLSYEEFANYWLKAIAGQLPETNNANYAQAPKTADSATFVTVLSKGNVADFVKDNEKVLLFSYSVSKHQDKNLNKFKTLGCCGVKFAVIDLTIDQKVESGQVALSIEEKEQITLYVNNKVAAVFDGELTSKSVADFIASSGKAPQKSAESAPAKTEDL